LPIPHNKKGLNVSAKPEATDGAKPPAKSKKLLIIILAVVLVLVLAGAGAFFYIAKQRAAAVDEDGEPVAAAHVAAPKVPPVYLPLDPMVVNLADPGGERVAQIGVTLVVADAHASDTVKAYLPTIRSGVLLLISQRTAEELLKQEGKEKLAKDILREASVPFGGGGEDDEHAAPTTKKKTAHADYPVDGVLFSSFIVQ
jgi:flagellar protein FliL